jgi:GT2 family glycosyltransferase
MIALVVPVMRNFLGFSKLMHSVDEEIRPIIIPNWDENIGVSGGWNAGLRIAQERGAETTIISNDDVAFLPGTIRKLVEGIESCDLLSATNYKHADHQWSGFDEHPDFSCFVVKTDEFIGKFGWFDESFRPAYFEDNDMAYRIKLAGGSYARDLGAGMIHEGSVTQNMDGNPVVTSPMFEQNRKYYIRKWGGQPGEEKFSEPFNGEIDD